MADLNDHILTDDDESNRSSELLVALSKGLHERTEIDKSHIWDDEDPRLIVGNSHGVKFAVRITSEIIDTGD